MHHDAYLHQSRQRDTPLKIAEPRTTVCHRSEGTDKVARSRIAKEYEVVHIK